MTPFLIKSLGKINVHNQFVLIFWWGIILHIKRLKVNVLPCPVQSQNINNNERMSNFKLHKYLWLKNNSANNVEADI